jgi:hypothetical protein
MTPVASVTGKNAVLNVFPEYVTYQKFGSSRQTVAWYPQIIRVDFRQMGWGDTGFIKVRAPQGNFDFVTHRLQRNETPDCPRAQALKYAYDMISRYWRPQGMYAPPPGMYPPPQYAPPQYGQPPQAAYPPPPQNQNQ